MQLKDFFDRGRVVELADTFTHAWPAFPRDAFVRRATAGLDRLELMDRGRHIARALDASLPPDFLAAAPIVERSLGAPRPEPDGSSMAPFFYHPHSVWVAERGVVEPAHLAVALSLIHAITQRFTGEWAIRPFLARYPDALREVLHGWVRDPSDHVRRLVSEGTRPRLPWGARVSGPFAAPEWTLPLLEALRDDPSEYVRRSVANHINDIAKVDPERVITLLGAWSVDAPPPRAALIAHALRWLGKHGHPGALALLGADADPAGFVLRARASPLRISVGDDVRVELEVENASDRPRRVAVELIVLHAGVRGVKGPRVIRGETLALAPGEVGLVARNVSFVPRSIRTIHPGKHEIVAQLNGARTPIAVVTVRAEAKKQPTPKAKAPAARARPRKATAARATTAKRPAGSRTR